MENRVENGRPTPTPQEIEDGLSILQEFLDELRNQLSEDYGTAPDGTPMLGGTPPAPKALGQGLKKCKQLLEKLCKKAKAGERECTALGKLKHKEWQPGPGYEKEFELPSGKRVDAINFEKQQIKELKPNNPRKIREGKKQAEEYAEEVEDWLDQDNEWDFIIETYD